MIPRFFSVSRKRSKHFQITFGTHPMIRTTQQSLFEYIWTSEGEEIVHFMHRRGKNSPPPAQLAGKIFHCFLMAFFGIIFFFQLYFRWEMLKQPDPSQTSFGLYLLDTGHAQLAPRQPIDGMVNTIFSKEHVLKYQNFCLAAACPGEPNPPPDPLQPLTVGLRPPPTTR